MTDLFNKYTDDLTSKISQFEKSLEVRNIGEVIEAGDGIAQVKGMTGVKSQELVQFDNGVKGIAFNLQDEKVGVIILGDYASVREGMLV
jgi:F-type H+-transporting ATPase subunit alpha